jgi:hypothetical protein
MRKGHKLSLILMAYFRVGIANAPLALDLDTTIVMVIHLNLGGFTMIRYAIASFSAALLIGSAA